MKARKRTEHDVQADLAREAEALQAMVERMRGYLVELKAMPGDRTWERAFARFEAEAKRGHVGTEPPMTLAADLRGAVEITIPELTTIAEALEEDGKRRAPLTVRAAVAS